MSAEEAGTDTPSDGTNVIRLTGPDGRLLEQATAAARLRAALKVAKEGGPPLANLSNLILIVRGDPVLAGLTAFNEFNGDSVLTGPPPAVAPGDAPQPGPYPRAWTDTDVSLVQSYVQRIHMPLAPEKETERAMAAAASARPFHPIRDWLAGLRWDGVARLDTWLVHGLGAEDTAYVRAVGSKFLIAAVRRVRQPGCKMDCILVLESPQGHKKSTVLSVLFAPWFSDSLHADLSSRDAAIGLRDNWCVELAELEQILRSESEIIKAYLSRAVDDYRPPYASQNVKRPRQCVLVGTTNKEDYLKDSENRRFWPVRVQRGRVELLRDFREQIWAEAAAREAAGEQHWFDDLTEESVRAEQEARVQDDVWEKRLDVYLNDDKDGRLKADITVSELLTNPLCVTIDRQDHKAKLRVTVCLRKMGWLVRVVKKDGRVLRKWFRPGTKF